MNVINYLTLATSLFLLAGPLQAADTKLEELKTHPQLTEKAIPSLDDQLSTRAHRRHHHHHSHSSSHRPEPIVLPPAFLYASTPLDYSGQDVGTAPVPSGTTIQVNFPVIGATSAILPVSENTPGIFTVLQPGHYAVNWEITVQNFNSDIPGGVAFETVILKSGVPQPPNPQLTVPPAEADTPSTAAVSGSILLPLVAGDTVQLNVTSRSFSDLPLPLVVNSAAIRFVRLNL